MVCLTYWNIQAAESSLCWHNNVPTYLQAYGHKGKVKFQTAFPRAIAIILSALFLIES